MFDERGQAYTLEGLVAAVLIASSVILGLQAVDVAPWTSGPDEDTLDSLRTQGEDALAVAAENGSIERAVTCLDGSTPDTNAYAPGEESATAFGPLLNETFANRGYSYNVFLVYQSGNTMTETLVYPENEQEPQEGTVTVSRRVALYDNMTVYESPGGACSETGDELYTRGAYGGDQHPDSQLYNVVEVRVEVW
jgi:hypothetical protein